MNKLEYPFLEKIRSLLEKKQERLVWLAAQIDKSERWFYDKSIERVELILLNKISELLEFNFLADYTQWRLDQNEDFLFIAREPEAKYERRTRKIVTTFSISTSLDNAKENSSKVLVAIGMACEKHGYEFDLL